MTAFVRWAHPPGIPSDRGTVVTVGTFDGVHLGHWTVLQEIRRRAEATGRRSVLVTFDPHPLKIVRPEHAPLSLTTPVEKKEILAESGLDYAVFISFTHALSRYEPRRFVEEILIGRLGVKELVIGYDHGFGRDREGDPGSLEAMGRELGFAVDVVAPVSADGGAISSSRIRTLLEEGAMSDARACLGRPYSIRGVVVRGEGRGKGLGFPTANIRVAEGDKLIPPQGIYAVRGVLRGGTYAGALHLGPRPTFKGSPPTIELHLMDFDHDIYGEEVRVDFIEHLRGIEPFTTVDALVEQIRQDVDRARRVLSDGE
ncbi:MAG: bifunctional riboflavin kinase/FAD synthetase [Gemmatimonadetes bacterium]|nr:bifunctional riboflavin kinase/FAD synthetase [Gemmatimonadota bacterium]NNF12752.1 bifunctional riboflavin kinase/FAD synthetase [Gemmatimonadota bacterium]